MSAPDLWPEWVYEKTWVANMETTMLDPEPFLAWVARQTKRLEVAGSSWQTWCEDRGITEYQRKKIRQIAKHRKPVSYAFVSDIVGAANYDPEDLYDLPEPTMP